MTSPQYAQRGRSIARTLGPSPDAHDGADYGRRSVVLRRVLLAYDARKIRCRCWPPEVWERVMTKPASALSSAPRTSHARLLAWVEEVAALTQPDEVHWCDGSAEEYERLAQTLVDAGTLPAALGGQAPELLPGAVRPRRRRAGRGPHVHLLEQRGRRRPDQQLARARRRCATALTELFDGSMRGRTMYVVPFSMGPLGSPIAYIGVELTDSPYVACSMRIMTRMGQPALEVLGDDGEFVPCLHSVGMPLLRRPRGRAVAVQRRATSTSSTSPRRARSGPTAPATAATRCWARSASRCASPR